MEKSQAKQIGNDLAQIIHNGDLKTAMELLEPLLTQRIPFTSMGEIGSIIGSGRFEYTNPFLSLVAATKSEGGWPVIGMALNAQLHRDFFGVFDRCRDFICDGDVWYCADILAERVPGPALLMFFDSAFEKLIDWSMDSNAWVRRSVGVAIHFWGKRSKGNKKLQTQAVQLLGLLTPMFTESEIKAVKGIGWGIKTLSRFYPDLVTKWMINEVKPQHKQYKSIMMNKAVKFLPADQKNQILTLIKR